MIPRGSFTFEIKWKTRDLEDKEGLIWWSNQAGSTLPSAWGFHIMQNLAVDLQKTQHKGPGLSPLENGAI